MGNTVDAMTKPKAVCSKSAQPSCCSPSVPESCSTVPLPEEPKSAPGPKYSDCVMALHGRFPPHTHSKIFDIANQLGIRYEHFSQHIAECTHLITTESEVNAPCLSFKLKIAALKNCKIVNISWLFKSLAQGHPVSVSGFELRSIELDKLKKKGLDNMKRAWEEENGKEIPSAKVPKIKLRVHGFYAELVDDAFPGPKKGLIVWTHAKIVYDATMFKLVRKESSSKPVVTFRRQQILHDPHMNEYHTWSYEKVDDVITEGNRAGLGDLESAKRAFEKLFQDTTGNTWDERHKKSTSSKFTFVECHFNDEWLNLQNLNPEGTASKVNEVFDLITTHTGGRKALVKNLVPSKYVTQPDDPLNLVKHELRLCLAILKQLLVYSDFTKKKAEWSNLIECYRTLVDSPKLSTSVDLESVKDEYEHLSYHRIISLAPQQELDYPGWTEAHLAQHIHRAVGLRTMLDPSTTEHNQLSNYFRFSTGSSPYYPGVRKSFSLINIFRIERLQEVQRYEKWIEKHDGRRRLLWHGSPNANFSGIFSQGLRGGIRESGIFASELAGISTAYSMKAGHVKGPLLMLLCEVSIAKRSDPSRAKYRDAKCIHPDLEGVQMLDIAVGESYNFAQPTMVIPHEHRMPSADQVRMRYLFHFKS